MVDFIRDAETTALITSDGPAATGPDSGEAGKIIEAMGGGLGLVYEKEDGQLYSGVGSQLTGKLQALVYEWDFDIHGGAVGTIVMDGPSLPANFLIQNAFVNVLTAVTSAGSLTQSFGTKSGATANLLALTAKASLTIGAKIQGIPDFATLADSIKETTAQRPVTAIAVADATAGRVKVVLQGQILA